MYEQFCKLFKLLLFFIVKVEHCNNCVYNILAFSCLVHERVTHCNNVMQCLIVLVRLTAFFPKHYWVTQLVIYIFYNKIIILLKLFYLFPLMNTMRCVSMNGESMVLLVLMVSTSRMKRL